MEEEEIRKIIDELEFDVLELEKLLVNGVIVWDSLERAIKLQVKQALGINPIAARIKVESSNLEYVSYNEAKQELTVWFKNRKAEEHYIYSNVGPVAFNNLINAESKGKYFISKIKGNDFTKVE